MPTAVRPPSSPQRPQAPRPPRLGRLRLSPIRGLGSTDLDTAKARGGERLPEFVPWHEFYSEWDWKQGEHVTSVGPTGSGKTLLNRYLLRRRDFVVVLAVKQRDKELFAAYEAEGYEKVTRFDPVPPDDSESEKLLFVTRTSKHGVEGRQERAKKLRQVLNDVYDSGGWTVYVDDVQYTADQLKLAPELEEIWIMGRSEGISLVASSQEPVDIPLQAYGQASHLFLFKQTDKRRADRMAELTGVNRDIARETILRLPDHEFLYVSKSTGKMVRSMVTR